MSELDAKTERAIFKAIGKFLKEHKSFNGLVFENVMHNKYDLSYKHLDEIKMKFTHLFEYDKWGGNAHIKEDHYAQLIADAEWTHVDDGLPDEGRLCDITIEDMGGVWPNRIMRGVLYRREAAKYEGHKSLWFQGQTKVNRDHPDLNPNIVCPTINWWRYHPEEPAPYVGVYEEDTS